MRAGLYVRISKDRTGAGLGVERQEDDCRALCERRGWKVADVYADNDISAFSGKRRPEWERLRRDIRAGNIDAIAVWHVDRLTRTPRELEDVIAFAERQGVELGTVTGDVDLGTATGRMVARILGSVARQESEHKSERQKRERLQAAKAGKVNGGGMRAYGYATDRVTIVEAEAAIVREAAERVLAGESLNSVARDFESRSVVTSAGNRWQARTLGQLLRNARISGRREHLGDIVGTAQWPAIISAADSDRLRQMLGEKERQTTEPGNPRSYLLSGILRCGKCGAGLVGRRRDGTPRYVCRTMPGQDWCGGTATNAGRTDAFIRDTILGVLAGPELRDRLNAQRHIDPELVAAVESDRLKLEELADMWKANELSRPEWLRARQGVQERMQHAERRIARAAGPDPLTAFLGSYEGMRAKWDGMNVSQRRAVVAAVVEKVVVHPSSPRVKWDPARFEPVWKA